MKKIACWSFAFLLVFIFGMGSISIPTVSARASEDKEIVILDKNFSSSADSLVKYGITENQVSSLTPVSPTGYQRMDGKSFIPDLTGEENNKYINTTINIDESVSLLNANEFILNSMALEMWVRIDLKPGQVTRGLNIQLFSADETNKISWTMSASEFKSLATRDSLSEFDEKIFGSDVNNATVGWVKLTLPISVGIVSGELVTDGNFNFEKMNIAQTTDQAGEVALVFFDIKIVPEGQDAKDRITSNINDFCVVSLKPSAAVVREGDEFYFGEIFPQFLATKAVYSSLYVGDEDYLDGSHMTDLKIRVNNGLSGNSLAYFAYGSYNFKLSSHNYNIAYGFFYDDKFVSALADNITVSDYGKGVWLEEIEGDFRVGEQKKISYTVHKAFKNATISFSSTDSEILKIVKVDKSSRYIIVECVKAGNAGVDILIEDTRLEGTEFEDSGIKNEDFKIQVLKAEKNVNTTKVMLWIALGLLVSGLIYLAVKAIIDSRKVEIK